MDTECGVEADRGALQRVPSGTMNGCTCQWLQAVFKRGSPFGLLRKELWQGPEGKVGRDEAEARHLGRQNATQASYCCYSFPEPECGGKLRSHLTWAAGVQSDVRVTTYSLTNYTRNTYIPFIIPFSPSAAAVDFSNKLKFKALSPSVAAGGFFRSLCRCETFTAGSNTGWSSKVSISTKKKHDAQSYVSALRLCRSYFAKVVLKTSSSLEATAPRLLREICSVQCTH